MCVKILYYYIVITRSSYDLAGTREGRVFPFDFVVTPPPPLAFQTGHDFIIIFFYFHRFISLVTIISISRRAQFSMKNIS